MNLLSKLHKNSILTGPVDSYCLVCACLLHSEEEAYAHIHDTSHVDKLNDVPQLTDYNDCVIKCKAGYFCRFCNVILPTIKRVSLHVAEFIHKDNRKTQLITRQANIILVFDSVVIDDRAWNGLDGSTCSVCNEDYDDEEVHRRDATHVLNLIQTACEFGDTYIYRKVDDELFFCLICNEILPIPDKSTHHESEKHLQLFEKSKVENTDLKSQAVIETNNNTLKLPNEVKSVTAQRKYLKPNLVNSKAENGSAHDINDDRHTAQNNKQKSASGINGNLDQSKNTAKVQIPEAKSEKTANDKTTQEPLNNNVVKVNETTIKETDKEPKPNNEIATDKKESYLYNILLSNNFIIKVENDLACCTLCDLKIPEVQVFAHTLDSHHKILYSKHIANKNSGLNPINRQSDDSKTVKTETKGELKTKEPKTAITDKDQVNKAAVKVANENDKSLKVKKEDTPKNNKDVVKNTVKPNTDVVKKQDTPKEVKTLDIKVVNEANIENQCINKENTPPNDKKGNEVRTIPPLQSKDENEQIATEPNAPSKKGSKKAQKKAAKARAEAEAVSKQATETDTSIPENTGPMTTEDTTYDDRSTNPTSNGLLTQDKYNKVDSQKDSKETMADNGIKTEKLLNFLQTISHVDSQDDVVINSKYVLGNISFVLVMNSDEIECVTCDERLEAGCVIKHINKEVHKRNVEESLVVTSLDDEFIRQVKTQEYHCGYCNIVSLNWKELTLHLDTFEHNEAKLLAAWRLHRYQQHLKTCETKEVRSVLTTIFRCTKE